MIKMLFYGGKGRKGGKEQKGRERNRRGRPSDPKRLSPGRNAFGYRRCRDGQDDRLFAIPVEGADERRKGGLRHRRRAPDGSPRFRRFARLGLATIRAG